MILLWPSLSVEVPIALRRQDRTYLRVRTARLGLEGCESFVDDLIGCRVLYSVRDALLHRSLEIQPWHFPIRYFKKIKPRKKRKFFSKFLFFLQSHNCWVAEVCDPKAVFRFRAQVKCATQHKISTSLACLLYLSGPARLDGRVVQGGRLKFSSLRRRGFEPHSSQN